MDVDHESLRTAVSTTIEGLRSKAIAHDRTRKVTLQVIAGLETELNTGEYSFRCDASSNLGGGAKHPRPMDYLLGGLLSCQEMWCLRWASLNGFRFSDLKLAAEGNFTWRGEYLEEVDSGLTTIAVRYDIVCADLTARDAVNMADTVGRRCPVFATLRKAAVIEEEIVLNNALVSRRAWRPGHLPAAEKL